MLTTTYRQGDKFESSLTRPARPLRKNDFDVRCPILVLAKRVHESLSIRKEVWVFVRKGHNIL